LAADGREGIEHGGDDALHAGPQDGIRAGWRLAVMAARLEGDIERGTAGRITSRGKGVDLGVGLAIALVPPLANTGPCAHHDGTDQRVGLDTASAPLRQRQRPPHPGYVRFLHIRPLWAQ
jgi:hypothetical protein